MLCFVGRADYFGNLPNLAARVMALANPGQILLEGFWGFGPELKRGPDDLASLLPQRPSRFSGEPDYEAVEVLQLGKFPIKVPTPLCFWGSQLSYPGSSCLRSTAHPQAMACKGLCVHVQCLGSYSLGCIDRMQRSWADVAT